AESSAPCRLFTPLACSASRGLAIIPEPSPIALPFGKRHGPWDERQAWRLVDDIGQPIESARVEPPGPLFPQQRVAAVVDQLLHEVRIRTHSPDGRDRQATRAAAEQ